MQRRRFVLGCGCAAFAALPWAGALGEWSAPERFKRPEAGSDEGGLWALMERE